jgi:hypothetical protein
MRRTRKHILLKNKTRKGGMNDPTTNRKVYPLLPSSPKKPEVLTNTEGLMPPQRGTNERQKRFNTTLKRYEIVKGRTWWNRLFGKKDPPPNTSRSYFDINKNNKGFKPSKHES